jgi:muramidase (phage lysozyme)
MARSETEMLIVELEARIAGFERNMKKAAASANKEFGAIERRAKQAREKVDNSFAGMGAEIARSLNLGPLGDLFGGLRGGAVGAAAGVGLITVAAIEVSQAIRKIITDVANLGDEAEKLGLPVEELQAFQYAARQGGLEAGDIVDIFGKLNLKISEAQTGTGEFAELLKANNISITDANGELRSQVDIFYDIADLIKNSRNEMDATNIASIAFSKSGKDFVGFLKQGAPAIRNVADEAKTSGAVIREDIKDVFSQIDDFLTKIWDTWSAKGINAIGDVLKETLLLLGKLKEVTDWQLSNIDAVLKETGLTSDILRDYAKLNPRQITELESIFPSLKGEAEARDITKERLDLEKQRTTELDNQLTIQTQIVKLVQQGAPPIELEEWNDRLEVSQQRLEDIQKQLDEIASTNLPDINISGMSFNGTGRLNPTVIPSSGSGNDMAQDIAGAVRDGIVPLIRAVEGTSGPGGYNTSLGNGRFLPGGREQLLTDMTLRQILALQTQMLRNPANTYNSSALGAYQIVQTTLKGLIEEFGLSLETKFTPQLQDQLGAALLARRGNDPGQLRAEWQGLEKVSDADILAALQNSIGLRNELMDVKRENALATQEWIDSLGLETASLQDQDKALSMTRMEAAKYLKQKELLAEAQARGITLTPQIESAIDQQAQAYAYATVKLEDHRAALQASEQASAQALAANKALADGLNGAFADSAKGFFTDIARGTDAVEALNNALTNLADRLLNLALDQVFAGFQLPGTGKMSGGTGKMSGGKMADGGWVEGRGGPRQDNILTGLSRGEFVVNAASAARHKAILETINAGEQVRAFATGGYVSGPGTGTSDSIPAMLSDGEFVMRAAAVKKIGKPALDALNTGQIRLPAFAKGGMVGGTSVTNASSILNGAPVDQSVTINAPVTVNASGGSPEQNADLAKRVSESVKNEMRTLVASELRQQMKPRGMLNP